MATSDDSGLYLGTADTAQPEDGDFLSKGAAEIRQSKIQGKNSFPAVTGAVTSTHTELNYLDGSVIGTGVPGKALVLGADYALNLTNNGYVYSNVFQANTNFRGPIGATNPNTGDFTTLTCDSFRPGAGATVTTILDEDTMSSNSASALATQQSIKAYVDSKSPNTVLTAVATTSGTTVVLTTAIPSTAKRVRLLLKGMSHDGSDSYLVQLGTSGGYVTTGYQSDSTALGTTASTTGSTSGFVIFGQVPVDGVMTLHNAGSNVWVEEHAAAHTGSTATRVGAGSVSLGGTLTSVRITSTGGASTFNAGQITISYDI